MSFDAAPLVRHLLLNVPASPGRFITSEPSEVQWIPHPHPTVRAMAEAAGVSDRTVKRWIGGGKIEAGLADRVATRLGLHPLALWPDFHADLAA